MNLDLTPLFRTSVGFDRMAQLMNQAHRMDQANASYPPYNIESLDENQYQITLALAGFTENDIEITSEQNTLVIRGKVQNDVERKFLHRGIATRSFERKFQLADHVRVTTATMENGLLHVQLVKEIPEAMKPRTIEINGNNKALESSKQTDSSETKVKVVKNHVA
ncbi:MAG TPA: Hsp20 family protein [Gammaproteobacteria bacterium]|nr:Hsp20 family protein [Gammaproteobacteria bacterium]HPI96021.1 Hsp20 family protein [Gammaproteobacteria bacterium]HPQ86970.1 Hsp20 family protein [Gammaproteobacteria bacterium]